MEAVEGLPCSGTRSVVGRRRANAQGSHESAPALPVLPVENTAYNAKARVWLPERNAIKASAHEDKTPFIVNGALE